MGSWEVNFITRVSVEHISCVPHNCACASMRIGINCCFTLYINTWAGIWDVADIGVPMVPTQNAGF